MNQGETSAMNPLSGKMTAGTDIEVNVTPLVDAGGSAVCALTPRRLFDQAYVVGGVILLPAQGAPYTVEFHLMPGVDNGQPDLDFDTDNPFSCNPGSCPQKTDHSPNMQPTATPKTLTIQPPPAAGAAQIHYSLNFSNGSAFDPIIVKT